MTPLPPLCLTGASGFVGRRVLAQLEGAGAVEVTLLVRDPSRLPPEVERKGWRVVQIDLGAAPIPAEAIPRGSVVLHLAATTGNASAATMLRVNAAGTMRLLSAAGASAARRFVFVSSVSAGYPDQRWAPYPQNKAATERAITGGVVPYTLVRPTMVFGSGSPNQAALERLATLAIPLLPGKGQWRVQPIHVDDLARALLAIARLPHTPPGPLTIGGPTVVTMRDLFAAIRRSRGLPPREPLSLPLGALRRTLAFLGALTGSRLPMSAGQFVAFANDAIAEPLPPGVTLPIPQVSLEAMLAESAHA